MLDFDKIRTSSTNRRWRILVSLATLIPDNRPSSKLCFSKRLSPSITRMKRCGNNGQPCLTPLPLLKKSVASPLIRTTNVDEVTQDIIQFVIWSPNPTLWKIILRRSQSMLSKAFLKSNFRIRAFSLFFLCCVVSRGLYWLHPEYVFLWGNPSVHEK